MSRALGDANADGALHTVCMEGDAGMTRKEVHTSFSRNMQAGELNRAVTVLANGGLIRVVRARVEKARPAERYHADELEESESESYLALALLSLHKAYLEDGQMPLYTKETK